MIAPVNQHRIRRYYDDESAGGEHVAESDGESSLQVVRDIIGDHPGAALAAAAVVGAAAAWIIKRGIR